MAKKNLKNNEDHFRSIVDRAVDAIININSSGKIVYVNKSICSAFDYKEADLLGKNVTMLMPKKYRAEHKRSMGRFLKTHKPHIIGKTVELVGIKSDGTEFPIELSLSVLQDKEGILFTGIIRDVSERKQWREQLETLSRFPSENPSPVFRITSDGHVQYANEASKAQFAFLKKTKKVVPAFWQEVAENALVTNKAQKNLKIESDKKIFSFTIAPLSAGESVNFYGIDITEEERVNIEIRNTSARLRRAQKIAKMGFLSWDLKNGQIELSEEASDIFGFGPKKRLAKPDALLKKIYPEDLEYVQENLNMALRGEKTFDIDHRIVLPDGQIKWVYTQGELICKPKGKAKTLIGTVVDITDRKEIESRLLEEEKRYRTLIESSAECICQLDLKGNFLFMNPTGLESHAIATNDELQKLCCFDLAEPAYHKVLKDTLKAAKTGEIQKFEYESETVDGLRWFESIMAPITDSSGKITSFIRLSNDITDRKKMEDELLESEKSYRTLVESSAECICQLDLKGNFLFMNPTGLKGHDITSNDELKKMNCCDLAEPAYHKVLKDTLKAAKTGEIQKFEYESETVDGIRWFESIMAPITDSSGKITSFIRLSNDVTDRKEKESLRRDNQEKMTRTLEGAVRALSITTALRDPYTVGHQERVSKLCCAIGEELGFSEDRLAGLRTAAELHDVGKVHVPAEILTKPGAISEHEFKIIQYHVQAGFDILEDIDFPWAVEDFVVQHHERLNGSGYPNGLKEKDILEEAKIIAVADVVEAMSSRRPYRAGLGIGVALKEISKNKGVLYDPKVVEVCLKLFRKKGFDFRSEKREKAA